MFVAEHFRPRKVYFLVQPSQRTFAGMRICPLGACVRWEPSHNLQYGREVETNWGKAAEIYCQLMMEFIMSTFSSVHKVW